MPTSSHRQVLRLSGFGFGSEPELFQKPLVERAFVALCGAKFGEVIADVPKLQTKVENTLRSGFQICLDHQELYVALRGGPIYWDTVAAGWTMSIDTSAGEVEKVVTAYAVARRNWTRGAVDTRLISLVDIFNRTGDRMSKLGAPATFSLTLRSTATGNHGEPFEKRTSNAWPPSGLTAEEVSWLSEPHIRDNFLILRPRVPRKTMDILRVPHDWTHPLDVKLFLAWTALAHYKATSKVAVYMPPIAYRPSQTRKDWWLASGGASKVYRNMHEFTMYAKDAFGRGKDTVLGLYTFWVATGAARVAIVHAYKKSGPTDKAAGRPDIFWSSRCQRFGVALVLRKEADGSTSLVMHDMNYRESTKRTDPALPANHGIEWKVSALKTIRSAFPGTVLWYGGDPCDALSRFDILPTESVGSAAIFLYQIASGAQPPDGRLENWGLSQVDMPEELKQVIAG